MLDVILQMDYWIPFTILLIVTEINVFFPKDTEYLFGIDMGSGDKANFLSDYRFYLNFSDLIAPNFLFVNFLYNDCLYFPYWSRRSHFVKNSNGETEIIHFLHRLWILK